MTHAAVNSTRHLGSRILFAVSLVVGMMASMAAHVSATETISQDGTWWTQLTDHEQVIAVEAILIGYSDGYNNGYIKAMFKDKFTYHATRSQLQMDSDPDKLVQFSKTFGEYQQSITDFYSAHPQSSTVAVGDVMACLADDPQFDCDSVAKFTRQ